MKIGDYIRIDGYISKIGHISKSSKGKTYAQWQQPNGMLASGNINIIEKSSSSIVDVIEPKDYVNGYLVLSVGTITWDSNGNPINRAVLINHLGSDLWLGEEFIRNVLTHEQFDKWMYKVGDINE